MRPPGYEPGELPTAPLRDMKKSLFYSDLFANRFVNAKLGYWG